MQQIVFPLLSFHVSLFILFSLRHMLFSPYLFRAFPSFAALHSFKIHTLKTHILLLAGVFGFYWMNTIWWGWICSPPLHHPSTGMQFGNGLCVCICVRVSKPPPALHRTQPLPFKALRMCSNWLHCPCELRYYCLVNHVQKHLQRLSVCLVNHGSLWLISNNDQQIIKYT